MKKVLAVLLTAVLALSLAACSNSAENTDNETAQPDSTTQAQTDTAENGKTLVIYFTVSQNSETDAVSSASVVDGTSTGILEYVALKIAENTGADTFSIQTDVKYPSDYNELVDYAKDEQNNSVLPSITNKLENLDDYETVFIGYPIWWYDMPQVMYSFFNEYDFSGKTIIPFCTHMGSEFTGTIEKIQSLEPNATVVENGFEVRGDKADKADKDIEKWVKELEY